MGYQGYQMSLSPWAVTASPTTSSTNIGLALNKVFAPAAKSCAVGWTSSLSAIAVNPPFQQCGGWRTEFHSVCLIFPRSSKGDGNTRRFIWFRNCDSVVHCNSPDPAPPWPFVWITRLKDHQNHENHEPTDRKVDIKIPSPLELICEESTEERTDRSR